MKRISRPPLRFTPYAWAKLLFLRDYGQTEIGGFGLAAAEDSLLIENLRLVQQQCSAVTVAFDDAAVADFFDEQVDAGRRPEQFARVWIHTHPGRSARPSATDEATFARCFCQCDWSVMCIVASGGASYARLQFGVGPGVSLRIPLAVDHTVEFPASDASSWEQEYFNCVRCLDPDWCADPPSLPAVGHDLKDDDWFDSRVPAGLKEEDDD